MRVTKTQRFMLYSLGTWFFEANEKIKDTPIRVSISKVSFIELVKNAGFAEKQERALYKNLETLEKSKLISYSNKELELTKRGVKVFMQVNKEIEPYLNVYKKLKDKNPVSYTKKVQTVFSNI